MDALQTLERGTSAGNPDDVVDTTFLSIKISRSD